MTLLRDIQNELAASKPDVESVLRKCKILAARLGSQELARWVDFELNGYPDDQPAPEYRKLTCVVYASFANAGWKAEGQTIPPEVFPEEFRENVSYVEFRDGMPKVMTFLDKGATIDRTPLVDFVQGKLFPRLNCFAVWQQISRAEFKQLVGAVESRILDFVLKIEAENPQAGEASLNTKPVPEEKVQSLVTNYFYGNISNVAQNSHSFSQSTDAEIRPGELAELVNSIAASIEELKLDATARQKAEAQIATLNAQLSSDPDPVIVRQAGRTLRNVTEGAIGSLIATAVQPTAWAAIHAGMQKLFG